jgi:glucokinase
MIIGVDLGGTRIRAALLDEKFNILQRVETLTKAKDGPDAVIRRIAGQIREVLPENKSGVLGIGVSSPGPLDPNEGVTYDPPNLPGWSGTPLRDILQDEFGMPVYLGNDANVAALAEVALGAARGYRHAIYITVSTGIGSGVITDGRMILGRRGFAVEAGHAVISTEKGVCSLEEMSSGTAIKRQAVERIQAGEKSAIYDIVNGDVEAISGKIVGQAAQEGDPLALEIVTNAGRMLGLGIVSLLHLFNPEIIVIGGSVTKLGDLLFGPMRAIIPEHLITPKYAEGLIITEPELGEDVSIYGAALLVSTQGGVEDIGSILGEM